MKQPSLIDKSPGRISAMFNRIAPFYDFLNHLLSSGMDLWWRKKAVSSLNLPPKSIVIDVATGTGDLAISLLRRKKDVLIVGIDIAEEMLKRALKKSRGYENYSIVKADGLKLPIKSEVADALMIAYGIRNMSTGTLKPILEEFRRVLKVGGLLLILEFSIPERIWLRRLYLFYFQRILPFLGGLISRDKEAYSYLPCSVESFIRPKDMAKEIEESNFKVLELYYFIGGVSYYIKAMKTG